MPQMSPIMWVTIVLTLLSILTITMSIFHPFQKTFNKKTKMNKFMKPLKW